MILGLPIPFILMDFFIFAFFGWIYESLFVSIRDRKLVNRGFLTGPVIPIYGVGAVLVFVMLRPFAKIPSLLYFMGMVLATIVEYLTAWILEVVFHTKWWDYSREPYNFQGRVALIPSMFWGVLSLLLFDVLQPAADKIMDLFPEKAVLPCLTAASGLMIADIIYTAATMFDFRKQLGRLYELRRELEEFFEHSESRFRMAQERSESRFHAAQERFRQFAEQRNRFLRKRPFTGNQRLLDAFPNMKLRSEGHSYIDVKELLSNRKKKTADFFREYAEGRKNRQGGVAEEVSPLPEHNTIYDRKGLQGGAAEEPEDMEKDENE